MIESWYFSEHQTEMSNKMKVSVTRSLFYIVNLKFICYIYILLELKLKKCSITSSLPLTLLNLFYTLLFNVPKNVMNIFLTPCHVFIDLCKSHVSMRSLWVLPNLFDGDYSKNSWQLKPANYFYKKPPSLISPLESLGMNCVYCKKVITSCK